MKVGAVLDSFGLEIIDCMDAAASLGMRGIQAPLGHRDIDPDTMTETAIADFLSQCEARGIAVVSGCFYVDGGFEPDYVERNVARTVKLLELGKKLGGSIVTGHIGMVPKDEKAPAWASIAEGVTAVEAAAADLEVLFGVETGPVAPPLLRRFLDATAGEMTRVNYDPANLVAMGFDPVAGVRDLAPYIGGMHAKDAIKGKGEVPLGKGEVPWKEFVNALRTEAGFDGWYIIEREGGADRVDDIRQAKELLEAL